MAAFISDEDDDPNGVTTFVGQNGEKSKADTVVGTGLPPQTKVWPDQCLHCVGPSSEVMAG